MAMISGPYTDAIVKMLMGEERRLFDGDILKNSRGQYGVFVRNAVWISDPVVRLISDEEFDVAHSKKMMFPEPFAGGFRFARADGSIWIPALSEAEKNLLENSGYHPVSTEKVLLRMEQEKGESHSHYFPLSCKTGIWSEEDIKKAAPCFERFGD